MPVKLFAALALTLTAMVASAEEPNRTSAQIRKDAVNCCLILTQFRQVQRDFFPKGLEKCKVCDLRLYKTPGESPHLWPPPSGYSWRVALMPYMEEFVLYRSLCELTGAFKTHANPVEAAFEKDPGLRRHVLRKMPSWLALNSKPSPLKSIYRRVVVPGKEFVFVVIESSGEVPWMQSSDDLPLSSKMEFSKLKGNFVNGLFALCGDGKIRFLRHTLTEKEFREALISGGGIAPIRESTAELVEDISALPIVENEPWK